jgi:hypothetical protein
MHWKYLVLVAVLALAGCVSWDKGGTTSASEGLVSAGSVLVGTQCDSASGQVAVGQVLTQSLLDQLRTQSGSASARELRPGKMITMEYDVTRLNVLVDEKSQITAVRCG